MESGSKKTGIRYYDERGKDTDGQFKKGRTYEQLTRPYFNDQSSAIHRIAEKYNLDVKKVKHTLRHFFDYSGMGSYIRHGKKFYLPQFSGNLTMHESRVRNSRKAKAAQMRKYKNRKKEKLRTLKKKLEREYYYTRNLNKIYLNS